MYACTLSKHESKSNETMNETQNAPASWLPAACDCPHVAIDSPRLLHDAEASRNLRTCLATSLPSAWACQ